MAGVDGAGTDLGTAVGAVGVDGRALGPTDGWAPEIAEDGAEDRAGKGAARAAG